MGGKPCIEDGTSIVEDGKPINVACRFWVYVQGKDPQTNQDISKGDCAMAWQPVLMIENSKVNRETGAAVESLRNESVSTGQHITQALLLAADKKRIGNGNV